MRRGVTLLSSILLGACATTVPLPVADTPASIVPPAVPGSAEASSVTLVHPEPDASACDYILRDLSVPWAVRDYWCTGEGASSDRSIVVRRLVQSSLDESRRQLADMKSRLSAVSLRTDEAMTHIQSSLSRTADTTDESSTGGATTGIANSGSIPTSADSIAATARVVTDAAGRIPFATSREVLGPRGRRMALALLPRVRGSASITLRGRLVDGEFPLTDALAAERRSVGRSLSVRELWRGAGVDVSSVSILHHDPAAVGKYVEVVFHD